MSNSAPNPNPSTGSSSTNDPQEIHWEVVAQTPGITPAHIIAGHLQAEGIPVRIWQEGAGQAIGLTVGLLGTGYVAVPAEYADQAEAILMESESDFSEEFLEEEE